MPRSAAPTTPRGRPRGRPSKLTRQRIEAEATAVEHALPAPRFLFAASAKAYFARHGVSSCTKKSHHVMDAELQRALRYVTEVAYHVATSEGRTRIAKKDMAYGYRRLKRSAYLR